MYNLNDTLRAIGRVMARYAQEKATSLETDEIIEASPLLKKWVAGTMDKPVSHEAGDVKTYENQPWKCAIAHTHHGEDGWDPVSSRTLWAPYHAKRKDYALPYVQPTAAHDAYQNGEWMVFIDGITYECVGNDVVHDPTVYPQGWKAYTESVE